MNLPGKKIDRNYNSTLAYTLLDCNMLRSKHLDFLVKSLHMGKGETIQKFIPPDTWHYPPPGSNEETVYKKVCNL